MKHKFTFFFALLLSTAFLQAQVTIGSNKVSTDGTLLMLDDGTTSTTNTNINAQSGLGLPRVELNTLTPLPDKLAESIGAVSGTNPWDKDEHVGLVVYNTKADKDACKQLDKHIDMGLYVWDGTRWESIGMVPETISSDVYEVIDSRDGEVYLARNFGDDAGDWMLENMRARKFDTNITGVTFAAGDNPESGTGSTVDPRWGYPNTPSSSSSDPTVFNLNKHMGLLYNWAAATAKRPMTAFDQGEGTNDTPNPTPGNVLQVGVQGICPNGWHLPSDKEWNTLEKELVERGDRYTDGGTATAWTEAWRYKINARGTKQGENMKTPCPPPSITASIVGKSLSAERGGFNALMVGYGKNGSAAYYGGGTYLWSSSSYFTGNAWRRQFGNADEGLNRNIDLTDFLFGVRCKAN